MNIVTILGSPRSKGNSTAIARRLTETAEKLGAKTRVFELNKLSCRGCQGCYACKKHSEVCVIKDDLTDVLSAVTDADIVVLSSPVYFGDVTAQLKMFIDRGFSYLKPDSAGNPQPSRLSPKILVLVLTQGHPDEKSFDDIYPRYSAIMQWFGFTDSYLIRACGIGPGGVDATPEHIFKQAEETARKLLA